MRTRALLKYVPIEYHHSIYEVDFNKFKSMGYGTLFFDLDNTIADYYTHSPSEEAIKLFEHLKEIGFNCFILSNNKEKRIKKFEDELKIKGYYSLRKPFTRRIKKYILDDSIDVSKVLWVGDQAVTDVRCAYKLNIKTILLDPINPGSEHWYTKVNRFIEKRIFMQIKKKLNSVYSSLGLEKRYDRY